MALFFSFLFFPKEVRKYFKILFFILDFARASAERQQMEGQPWPLWLEEGVSLSAFTDLWTVQQTTGLRGINEESLNKFENPIFKL